MLVAAREADEGAPLGELVEPSDLDRQPQRVPSRQHVANRPNAQMVGIHRDIQVQSRDAADLEPFGMQVMLGEGDHLDAQVLGHAGELDDLLEHHLPALVVRGDRTQPLALLKRAGNRG